MAIIKIGNPAIDLDAAEIPNLSANKITSGTFDNARISLDAAEIPNLDTAKITTGTLADARIPANALNSNIDLTNLSASNLTSGTVATARLGSGTADATTFLRGDNTFASAGGANTPAFSAERSGAQSISDNTRTTILFNNEFYDSSSAYNTSTGKFTPQTAGKYFVQASVLLQSGSNSNFYRGFAELYKNSSVITEALFDEQGYGYARARSANVCAIVDMNGSSDFLLIQGYISATSTGSGLEVSDMSTFQAFKIIE